MPSLAVGFSPCPRVWIYTTGQKFGIFGKHIRNHLILHFNFLQMAWHQPQINIVTLLTLPCVVLWKTNEMCNVQKKDIHRNLQKCIIFNISPKMSHNFQGIQHYMVNLWKYYVYSKVRYWYHAKFTMGSRKTIWVYNQSGRQVWLKVQYFVIWCHNENLLHFCKSYLLNTWVRVSLNFDKHDL